MQATLSKRFVTGAMVAAALSSSLPASAESAPVSPKKPAAKQAAKPAMKPAAKPGALDAFQALFGELEQAKNGKAPISTSFKRLGTLQPSPVTAAKLRAAFGTDRLYTMSSVPAAEGMTQYRMTILPVHHATSPTSRIEWDAGTLDFVLDKDEVLTTSGTLDKIVSANSDFMATVRGIGLEGRQSRSKDGLWFGAAALRIGSVQMGGKDAKEQFSIEGVGVSGGSIDHGQTVDVNYDIAVASAGEIDQRVNDIHLALRITGIERRTMLELQETSERLQAARARMTPKQQTAATSAMLQAFAKLVLAQGGLDVDDFSAAYRGNKVAIKGHVALPGAAEADMKDPRSLLAKLSAQFEARIPLALVRDIANQAAAAQVRAKAASAVQRGEPAPAQDPASVAQLGQTMTDVVVGRVVGNGYARLEDEVMVLAIDYRDGALRANGKPVDLNKLFSVGAAAAAGGAQGPTTPPAPAQAQ